MYSEVIYRKVNKMLRQITICSLFAVDLAICQIIIRLKSLLIAAAARHILAPSGKSHDVKKICNK